MLNKSQIINYLNSDIDKLKSYQSQTNSFNSKKIIEEKLLFIEIKKIYIDSNCEYLTKAYDILKDENRSHVKEALNYLVKNESHISKTNIANYHLFKALIYEILNNKTKASKEYKKALKYKFNKESIKLYKDFVNRSRPKESKGSQNSISTNPKELNQKAKDLEHIAKNYLEYYNDLDSAKKYYKQALFIYKSMMKMEPSKFKHNYILALIKGVETYKLNKELLNEAESILFYSNECIQTETYLLNKIKALKAKEV